MRPQLDRTPPRRLRPRAWQFAGYFKDDENKDEQD
jgi:hypothetical protein